MSFSLTIRPVLYDAPLPLFWGKVAMEKVAIINTFGPVSINGRCIGYMLAEIIAPGSVLLSKRLFKFEFQSNGCRLGK